MTTQQNPILCTKFVGIQRILFLSGYGEKVMIVTTTVNKHLVLSKIDLTGRKLYGNPCPLCLNHARDIDPMGISYVFPPETSSFHTRLSNPGACHELFH